MAEAFILAYFYTSNPIKMNILANDESKVVSRVSTTSLNFPLSQIIPRSTKGKSSILTSQLLSHLEPNGRPSLGLPDTPMMNSINF